MPALSARKLMLEMTVIKDHFAPEIMASVGSHVLCPSPRTHTFKNKTGRRTGMTRELEVHQSLSVVKPSPSPHLSASSYLRASHEARGVILAGIQSSLPTLRSR